jgi:hypothetical protein
MERRGTPCEQTWTNEAFTKRFVNFLLMLEELMWRHLIGALSNRSSAWFQVDDEFDSSSRGHSWKFLWKDILKVMDDWNVLDSFER